MIHFDKLKLLYSVNTLEGYSEQDIALIKEKFTNLPQVLEDYYRVAGKTQAFHHVQDTWILPEHFQNWKWLQNEKDLVLLNENQGVCRAVIRKEDMNFPNPPVYITDDEGVYQLCSTATSEFLNAALYYQAVFAFEYNSEEFYWLTEEELAQINTELTKQPFELQNWLGVEKIMFYSNAPDNMVAIMDFGEGDLQMLYGAANELSFSKLMRILEGMGEPV